MSNFIPYFHYTPPIVKQSDPKWAMLAVGYYYYNTQNYSLLWDKDVISIDGYRSGDFSLLPFKKMFKSEQKRILQNANPNTPESNQTAIGLDYTCLDLMSEKFNSAEAIIQKIPIEISCVATDPLAIEKKKSDINFLKNKPRIEAELQEVNDKLNLGKVDLGATQHSSVEFSDSPFGLDLNNPEELYIFVNLLYSLKIETAFETALAYFQQLKKIDLIKLMEIKDQFKYGVSVNKAFKNDTTGLPDAEYVYPGSVLVPYSKLPDYSDNTHRIIADRITPMQLFDYFASEIKSEEQLEQIINAAKWGYCACNKIDNVPRNNWDTFRLNINYIEVKTVDYIGVKKVNKNSKFKTFTTDEKQTTEKIWAQNTYGFWWLVNTDQVFGMHRLDYSQRARGKECYQNFSTSIYKSQEKSAVEQSIGENKKAQIAEIKLQHAVIMSKPQGGYFDLKYVRAALAALKDETNDWNMDRLLTLMWEQNIMLGDSSDFDGSNEGQFKPFQEMPGGLRAEIVGYMNIIAAANINISRITGVNQQLTGASANEEGLVGLQKLLINASINALHYCNEAIENQYKNLFSIWGNIIQQAIEAGGAPKQAIIDVIGTRKVGVIEGLKDVGLHQIGIFVKIKQREEERQQFRNKLTQLELQGIISASDAFMVNNIPNPKDQWGFIAVKEQQYKKDKVKQQEALFAQQQAMVAKQGENQVAAQNAETEGGIKKEYAKGHVNAQITQLAGQLQMSALQLEGLLKKNLQTDRNKAQTEKNIATLAAKSEFKQQEALPT